ncbi:MAG TPA: DUF885 family protein, partial [Allosphingosinicella sp.]
MRRSLILAAALLCATPAAATPAEDFSRLLADHYDWLLRTYPTTATALGVHDYDDRIEDLSMAAGDRYATEAEALLKRLEAIPADQLNAADRTNHAILKRSLSEAVEGNRYPQRMMLFTTYYGWHQGFAGLADNLPFHGKADYDSYLTRLSLYPQQNDQALAVTDEAVKGGYVLPCSVLTGYDKTISGV